MQLFEADERTTERDKRLMNVIALFIADLQPAILVQPRLSALHHPTNTAQPFAALNTSASNPGHNAPLQQGLAAYLKVIRLVCMHLVRTSTWTTRLAVADRRDSLNGFLQNEVIVDVGPRQHGAERCALGVYHHMALGALFASIRGIGPHRLGNVLCPPFGACGAGTLAESRLARDQSS